MRNELNLILKDFLQDKLKEVKQENRLTQESMANILQMQRRTFAGVMRGEYSLGGLSTILYIVFLTKDAEDELQVLREKFLEILGEDWEEEVTALLSEKNGRNSRVR